MSIRTQLYLLTALALMPGMLCAQSSPDPGTTANAQDSVSRAQGGSIGGAIAGAQVGAARDGKKHPWYDGNPNAAEEFTAYDTAQIANHFLGCFDIKILDICGFSGDGVPCLNVEYYWPETVIETNNFMIGSTIYPGEATALRESFIANKEAVLSSYRQFMSQAEIPGELKRTPHAGNTTTENLEGETENTYEAHIYRTFFDYQVTSSLAGTGFFLGAPACSLPPPERLIRDFTEAHPDYWRIPEMWPNRVHGGDGAYSGYYGPIVSLAYKNSICAKYRAGLGSQISSMIKIDPDYNPELAKLCMVQSENLADLGQLFPTVWTTELQEPIAQIVMSVRANSIFDWEGLEGPNRSNYFNPVGGSNLYRDQNNVTHVGDRPADKIQRIYPEPSGCFRMSDISERDQGLFPKGMLMEPYGNHKIVHWNRRRTCLCVSPSIHCRSVEE
ncbi:hypothetical protein JNK13_00630 [bacterium]|nr:hypothetical protein [bacterium]